MVVLLLQGVMSGCVVVAGVMSGCVVVAGCDEWLCCCCCRG